MRVLYYLETSEGRLTGGSLELLGSSGLFDKKSCFVVFDPELEKKPEYEIARLISDKAKDFDLILTPGSNHGKAVASLISGMLSLPGLNNVTKLSIEDDGLEITRPIYAAKILEKMKVETKRAAISIRIGSFDRMDALSKQISKNIFKESLCQKITIMSW